MTRFKFNSIFSLLVVGAVSWLVVSDAKAGILNAIPVADATFADGNIDGVFEAVVNPSSQLLTTKGSGAGRLRAGMEFDISTITGTSWVTSATLKISLDSGIIPQSGTMSLYGYSGNGINELSDASATNLVSSFGYDLPSTHTSSITSFISGLIQSGDSFAGVTARSTAFGTGARIWSSEAAIVANRPLLSIDYDLNDNPIADAGGSYSLIAGDLLTLDASNSTDADIAFGDSITSYQWDLNNDTIADFTTTSDQLSLTSAQYTSFLPTSGNYTVGLRVTDELGFSGTTSVSLAITAVPEPNSFAIFGAICLFACGRRRVRNSRLTT